MQAMQLYYIFSFGTPLPRKFVLISPSNSLKKISSFLIKKDMFFLLFLKCFMHPLICGKIIHNDLTISPS